MISPEDRNSPQQAPFEVAKRYMIWLSEQQQHSFELPTLLQLKAGLAGGHILAIGKEWTSEGWIYDPILSRVNKNPGPNATAVFRAVSKTPPPPK